MKDAGTVENPMQSPSFGVFAEHRFRSVMKLAERLVGAPSGADAAPS